MLALLTLACWAGLIRLAAAMLRSELDWRTVAEYSRRDAPWHYRLASVWGGLAGSLWLFIAIFAAVSLIALRRGDRRPPLAFALATVAALTTVALLLVSPFERLAVPAIGGFGLTPILEHPAMAIHPPLLYVGLAATFGALLSAWSNPGDHSAVRWNALAVGGVTLAMTFGALWSYVEQGWGGYWAWDPVENTSLLVWVAAVAAVHRRGVTSPRTTWSMQAAPWMLTLIGACVVRSGSTPSIHGFGQQVAVGWWLLAITIASLAVVVVRAVQLAPGTAHDDRSRREASMQPYLRLLALIFGVVVFAGTMAPIVVNLVAERPSAVRGRFYSAFAAPIALIALPLLVLRVMNFKRPGWLAHLGGLLLIVGIAVSTFDTRTTVLVNQNRPTTVHGIEIALRSVEIEPGPRAQATAVVAVLDVDGQEMRPSLVAYRDRGGRLAENVVRSRPWQDIQVQLDNATDAGVATLTVYTRPLMWLLWLGPLLVTVGVLKPARRGRISTPDAGAYEPTDRPSST